MLLFDTIQSLPLADKRALAKSLKDLIKNDVLLSKVNKQSLKQAKEIEKKQKIEAQIAAATAKLAKLQAKLA